MSELKPCPFCGSVHVGILPHGTGEKVVCSNCGMSSVPFYGKADSIQERLLKAWNRRTDTTNKELIEILEEIKPLASKLATWGATGEDVSRLVNQAINKAKGEG